MKNPILSLENKKVLADGKPIGEVDLDALSENIVFYYTKDGTFLSPPGWFFLNLCLTPKAALEVAAPKKADAKENMPIVFFPGTFNRRPNFPVIWRKKMYHPEIIAAVQGQFRGDTLHIEFLSVKSSYRRNKIATILVDFLEKYFTPKMTEGHDLTDDGKKFEASRKKNPYPDDNILPDDFKANVPDWNFKLNVKGVSDDFYAPVELEVMNGFLFGHIEGSDGELYPYELGNVAVMLVRNLKYLPVKHSTTGRMKGYVRNVDAIVREIIEKGMKQEGYRPKKNPIKPNEKQIAWAGKYVEGIAFYDIDPLEFLRLTAESPEHFQELIKMKSFKQKSMEFYNSPEAQADMTIHPALWIGEDGKIDGHEGRHRAAATYNAGEKTYRIAIVAEERGWPVKTHGWRWKRRLKVPPQLIAQYPDMDRYTHQVDPTKLEEIPTYYQVDKEDDVRTTRKKKNPVRSQATTRAESPGVSGCDRVKLPKLDFEEIE